MTITKIKGTAAAVVAGILLLAANQSQADSLLFWDFENATTLGAISTSVGASSDPGISGFASQNGGGPVEFFGNVGPTLHLTRFFGETVNFPFITFTTTKSFTLDSLSFNHIHNHNRRFSTFPSYKVQLQIDTGSGFVDIGSPILAAPGGFDFDDVDLGSTVLAPGTYTIRWVPRGLNPGLGFPTNTDTEFFALDGVSLSGRPTVDHYQCYKVSENSERFEPLNVELSDQFGNTIKTVKKSKFLCAPVDKNGEGVLDAETHLVCYEVKKLKGEPKSEKRTVSVTNQFVEDQVLEVKKPKLLCVPSRKKDLGPVSP